MLCTAPDNQIVPGATINVTQMATLVEDMVKQHQYRQLDEGWFHERIATAHLNQHEASALIAMYERLQEKTMVLSSDGNLPWG